MKTKSTKGFTLVEVLVAAGILMIVTLGIVSGISQLFRLQRINTQGITDQQIVAMITEGVKADSAVYQKNMSSIDLTTEPTSKLPLGYMDGMDLVPRASCPTAGCQLYVGYVIQPMSGIPGLYQGVIRVFIPKSDGSASTDNVYRFLTTAK